MEEGKADKPQSKVEENLRMLAEAKATAERIEKGNAELKALLERQEKINIENILSGRVNAGIVPPKEKSDNELSPQEYVEKFKKGEIKIKLPGI